ncbi:hypothetical protein [Streptomyces sp. KL116D]
MVCADCGEPLTADAVRPRTGPGHPPRLAARPDVRARFEKN